jgi:hypothetical protein
MTGETDHLVMYCIADVFAILFDVPLNSKQQKIAYD